MAKLRLLVSWIGHADLRSMSAHVSEKERAAIEKVLGRGPADELGPIKSLLVNERFDEVHLLSNYDPSLGRAFVRWLGTKTEVHQVKLTLSQVTDYEVIFDVVNERLDLIRKRVSVKDADLCIHLSPGTPAMTAIWVLLGKTRYPATFYQTHKGKAWKTEIPFDIACDFVPELLRAPDIHLQQLAAQSPGDVQGFQQIIGDSQAIRLAVGKSRRAAMRHIPILILGESGTGKEMFARAIHAASPRRNQPLVSINCAAIPRELLEAELFGHVKGAFTGAVRDHNGAFDQADGGTLFLDEIGECEPAMQVKLLRVLEPPPDGGPCDCVFRPVGGTGERRRNVRIVAATNRNLITAIGAGQFREDLYYRLAVVTINLPSLRERRMDIPKIASHLLNRINEEFRRHEPTFRDKSISATTMEFVKRQEWPGNVRQLYNALLQAVTMTDADAIDRTAIAGAVASVSNSASSDLLDSPLGDSFCLEKHLEEIQRRYLRRAMVEANGVKTKAAMLLGMKNYQTLDAQLKRLKVPWPRASNP